MSSPSATTASRKPASPPTGSRLRALGPALLVGVLSGAGLTGTPVSATQEPAGPIAAFPRSTMQANKGHPGFLLNPTEIALLGEMIERPGPVRENWLVVRRYADSARAGRHLNGGALTERNYQDWAGPKAASRRDGGADVGVPLASLGLAYALTGEVSYAARAREVMRAFVASGGGPVGALSNGWFDGFDGAWLFSMMFAYDLVYHAVSEGDRTAIEGWLRRRVDLNRPRARLWGGAPRWSTYQGLGRLYVVPEDQVPVFYGGALGYPLEDPSLIRWGAGDGFYPIAFDEHATRPTGIQNPYSWQHFLHDAFLPNGSSARFWDREGAPPYALAQYYAAQVLMQAAWQRGVDLWRYRDAESGNTWQAAADWVTRVFVQFQPNPAPNGDWRTLLHLPYSHFRSSMYRAALDWTGPPPFERGRDGWSPRLQAYYYQGDYFRQIMFLISAFDRSVPAPVPGEAITHVPGDRHRRSVGGADGFLVVAPDSAYSAGDEIPVTVTAVGPTGQRATEFTGTVRLHTGNWSPATTVYRDRRMATVTVIDPAGEPQGSLTLTFTPADRGRKTTTVRLMHGGVGTSYRIEAIHPDVDGYPRAKSGPLAAIRGYSAPIVVTEPGPMAAAAPPPPPPGPPPPPSPTGGEAVATRRSPAHSRMP
ncbi:MAG: hypothetical protein R2909_09750 [Gemmatimonadales bacterium]